MINFSNAVLAELAVHYVGNKSQALHLTSDPFELSDVLREQLKNSFLNPFAKNEEKYEFTHQESLQYNEAYNYISAVFSNKDEFIASGQRLARHLHNCSDHPKIKGGELYIALFKNIAVGERLLDAVGIFKSENKAGFFEVDVNAEFCRLEYKEGMPANKIEKACLVINDPAGATLPVYIIDNQNKSEEAQFWTAGFLQVHPAADNYHHTKNFLTVTKQFITEQLSDREDITRIDQVNMLDKSVGYFKEKEQFDINEFNNAVFKDPEIIESFQQYGTTFLQQNNMLLADQFEINNAAVKKQSRIFKSVLKLDKNFHIYIHGNRDMIEQGYDELTGKKYYKLYFDEES